MAPRTLPRRARAAATTLLLLASSTAGVAVAGAPPAAADPPTRPNIVVINTDDQRFDSLYACLPAIGLPIPDNRTPPTAGTTVPPASDCPMPHVRDDLMAHGVTFAESFVTTSLCCPSRASLFLGEFAHHTGVLTNEKPDGGFSAFRNLQDSTVARWLHDDGYRTSLIGKYLNQYDSCANVPSCAVPQGWDDWHAEITDGDVDYTNYQLADSQGNGQAVATQYNQYSTTLLGQKAVSFIQDTESNHPTQPLFLYLAPFAPHPDAVAAAGDNHVYDSMTWRNDPATNAGPAPPSWNQDATNGPTWSSNLDNNPDHAAEKFLGKRDTEHRNEMEALIEVDRQVHDVVQALGTEASNTLFVFTSDNGLSWGEHRYFDKKNCEFEECHRVPMVVRYDPLTDPTGTGGGRVDTTHAALNIDIAPTAADAAQLTGAPAMDGRSLLPLLDADPGNDPPDWRTSWFGEDYGGLIACSGCVKTPTLKLIRTMPSDPLGAWKYVELCDLTAHAIPCPTTERELYDETDDPYEMNNLAVADPAPGSVQAVLAARLQQAASTQAPLPAFTHGPPPSTPDDTAMFAFSAFGASRWWCSLDGAPRTPCTSPVTVDGLASGAHTFAVVAEGEDVPDGVTGTSAAVVRSWSVDTAPPDTTITAGPSGATNVTTAQFSFTSNEQGATFQCSIDGAPFTTCTSPATYPGLGEGPHTFAVAAVDAASNVDPTPGTRAWTVDVTPPDTSIDSGPSGATNQPGPFSLTFSSNEPGSTFQCRPSGGGFTACTSPYQYPVPGDGNYSLTVKATDPAGNTDPTPAVQSWTVDTTPPATPALTQQPTDPSGPSATFAWTESDPTATFTCTLDGSPSACTSPVTYPGLFNGVHAFSVVATDPAGNQSSPAQYSWTVSTSGPVVTITSGPEDGSSQQSRSAKFKFSSNMQQTSFTCSLDGADFTPCSTGIQYTQLPDGVHTFAVRGTASGTTGAPAQRTWTVDNIPPDTTILTGPTGSTSATGPFAFTFSSNEPGATFKCRLDAPANAFAPCTTPHDVAGPLAAGSHTFDVQAVDAAGNLDATWASRTWTIDTTPPPAPAITQKPPAVSPSARASFSFTDTDGTAVFQCSLDGAPASRCTSPQTYSGLTEAQHTFVVTAVDPAGNPSPPASWAWTVDTTPPDTTITDAPSGTTTSTTAQVSFTSDDSGATFQCSLDGAAFSACTSPASFMNLALGGHTVSVRAVDAAGNPDPTPAAASWTVAPSTPDTTIISGPASGSKLNVATATFTFSATTEGSTFECSLDGAPFSTCTSGGQGAVFAGLADGAHSFAVAAQANGNTDQTPDSRTWTIDRTPPTVSLSAPTADQFLLTSPLAVKWTAGDPAPSSGALAYSLLERAGTNGTFGTVYSGTAKQASRPVGQTTCWEATATDPAGNGTTSAERCAAVPIDDRSGALAYTAPTQQVDDAGAYRGTTTVLTGAGADVTFSFTGRRYSVLMQKRPNGGKAKVFLDGTLVKTVDTYASSVNQKKFLWTAAVPAGPHTLRVAWTGTKNKSSSGTDVAIDAVAVIGDV